MSKNQNVNQKGNENRILRLSEVVAITGLSSSTLWRLHRVGKFPLRRRLSPGAVGWIAREVEEWIEKKIEVVIGNVEFELNTHPKYMGVIKAHELQGNEPSGDPRQGIGGQKRRRTTK